MEGDGHIDAELLDGNLQEFALFEEDFAGLGVLAGEGRRNDSALVQNFSRSLLRPGGARRRGRRLEQE